MKYRATIKELDVQIGDIVVCVSENSGMFTSGVEYEVEQADDGRLGLMCDCGFVATTSASLFTPLKLLAEHEVTALKSNPTAPWSFPLAHIWLRSERPAMPLGEVTYLGSGIRAA